ncbi:retrotransposon ORF1 [Tanacetum coccineum]|uniref:Retrotransposon ORF1 n=1 Tax=Tanacetum coccineum TaxID=301880 RepID=A0ABQ5EZ81_9ASTR
MSRTSNKKKTTPVNTNRSEPTTHHLDPIAPRTEPVRKLNSMLESLGLVPQSSNTKSVYSKEDDGEVIEIIRDDDEPELHLFEYFTNGLGSSVSIIDLRCHIMVLKGEPFLGNIQHTQHDPPEGVVRFIRGADEVAYKMPHKIEQYDSLSDLEKKHTKSVYLRNEEDQRRGLEYVMSKILGFYKECLELGTEYLTGVDDKGEVT